MGHPFIPVPNTLQLEAVYSTPGGVAENVYHVQGTGPYTDINATANRLIAAYETWESGLGKMQRSGSVALIHLRVRDIGQQNGPVVEKAENIPGGEGGGPLPDNVSVSIKWATALSGRSYRGRSFHIGLTTNDVTGDTVNAAKITQLIAAYESLRTGLAGAGWLTAGDTAAQLVVVSLRANKAWRLVGVATPVIAAKVVNSFVASRRTRLLGRHLKR